MAPEAAGRHYACWNICENFAIIPINSTYETDKMCSIRASGEQNGDH